MNDLFSGIQRVHFVGIKGVAMCALAVVAREKGLAVSGSDVAEVFPTDAILASIGIQVTTGFSADHISQVLSPDLVIYTGAHGGRNNEEVIAARAAGIPVLAQGVALGKAMEGKRQISVAGSHGKTTTSAMIAAVFLAAGRDPSYAIGCGEIVGVGNPGHNGSGDVFIAEADEYSTEPGVDTTPRFLWQHPEVFVVTNIDFDHPDAYTSLDEVKKAFVALSGQMQGKKVLVVNADDPHSDIFSSFAGELVTYGKGANATLTIKTIESHAGTTQVTFIENGAEHIVTLKVPGAHNAYNAAAAALAARAMDISWDHITHGLALFGGSKRRFEYKGEYKGARVYDDYAHHPKELAATIEAVRSWFPVNRIIVIFQPHTYSRTKSLLPAFASSFGHADTVILTDIYASARESDTLGITGRTLADETAKKHTHVIFAPRYDDVCKELSGYVDTGDIVLFMGAGDIYGWSSALVAGKEHV